MRLIITPECEVARVCREAAPSHLLRLVSPDHADAPPDGPMASLTLPMHDITAPRPGLTAPSRQLIQALLAFGAGWNGARPLVAQCLAGVSRSTAAAFIIACQKRPEVSELQMALALRRFAPQATPNPLMVAHADALLQRSGRMVAALAAIGRGCEFTAAVCAELDIAAFGAREWGTINV
jgi:predicted protein tyrosine phosphatase